MQKAIRPADLRVFVFDSGVGEGAWKGEVHRADEWLHCQPGILALSCTSNRPIAVEVRKVGAPEIDDPDAWEYIAECPLTVASTSVDAGAMPGLPSSDGVLSLAPGNYTAGVFARGLGTKAEHYSVQLWNEPCAERRTLKPYSGKAIPPRPLTARGLKPARGFDKVNVTIGLSLVVGVFAWPLLMATSMVMNIALPSSRGSEAVFGGLVIALSAIGPLISVVGGFYLMRWLFRAGMLPSSRSYFLLPLGNFFLVLAMLPPFVGLALGGQVFGSSGMTSALIALPALVLCPLGLAQLLWVIVKRAR